MRWRLPPDERPRDPDKSCAGQRTGCRALESVARAFVAESCGRAEHESRGEAVRNAEPAAIQSARENEGQRPETGRKGSSQCDEEHGECIHRSSQSDSDADIQARVLGVPRDLLSE